MNAVSWATAGAPERPGGRPVSLETLLAGHPFWADLDPKYLPLLASRAGLAHFAPQEQIFATDSEADRFYLICEGLVSLETQFLVGKGVVPIQTLGSGDALGWSWYFPPYKWHFSSRALEPTETLVFDGRGLRQDARRDHDFGYELSFRVGGVLLDRLQATRLHLLEIYEALTPHSGNTHHER